MHKVQVFIDEQGNNGNYLPLLLNASQMSDAECLDFTAEAKASECVFINNPETGDIRIFNPKHRMRFGGHPLVGTAWALSQLEHHVTTLNTGQDIFTISCHDTYAVVTVNPGTSAPWTLREYSSLKEFQTQNPYEGNNLHDYLYYHDDSTGITYTRAFTSASGTIEDEATGSAAAVLTATLKRDLDIIQGKGSRIYTKYLSDRSVELKGFVKFL